jgi:IclR family pca regulon transcriptional regulator
MPKLKRSESEERATDFVESLDRGLRLLQKFGATSGPMTLSDLARAADLPRATFSSRSSAAASLRPTASCSR